MSGSKLKFMTKMLIEIYLIRKFTNKKTMICALRWLIFLSSCSAAILSTIIYVNGGTRSKDVFWPITENTTCTISRCESFLIGSNMTCYHLLTENFYFKKIHKCGSFSARIECCFEKNHQYSDQLSFYLFISLFVGMLAYYILKQKRKNYKLTSVSAA